MILYLSLFSHFWYIASNHSFVFFEEHLATQYLKNISNIFAKLLFKIKLCLNLSSCYQNWLPCWLCFVHAIVVILLITDFKVLFLLWICTWLLQTMLTSSSDKLKTLTIYFSLSFFVIIAFLCNHSVPVFRLKPFETQDWQFYSVALGYEWGVPGLSLPILCSEGVSQSFGFFSVSSSCPTFYWSKLCIAQLLATVILLGSCVYEDYGWFLEILGIILWEYRGDFFFFF